MDIETVLAGLFELIAPALTEKQQRLRPGASALAPGRGGDACIAAQAIVTVQVPVGSQEWPLVQSPQRGDPVSGAANAAMP